MLSLLSLQPVRALLLLVYVALILFGSLYPFSGWRYSEVALYAFFFPPSPRYITRTDIVTNLLAYLPLGMLGAAYFAPRLGLKKALGWAILLGAGLSLAMEIIQLGSSSRHASAIDWATNIVGTAIGATLGAYTLSQPRLGLGLSRLRRRWFLSGTWASMGLVLLALGFFAELRPFPRTEVEVLHYEALLQFALTGISMGFLAALLVHGEARISAFAIAILLMLLLRAATTLLLYKFSWLRLLPGEPLAGAALGLGVGLLALRAHGSHLKYMAGVAVALLLFFLQLRNWLQLGKPQDGFLTWWQLKPYLFNFTGAAQAVSEVWPLLTLAYLFLFVVFARERA